MIRNLPRFLTRYCPYRHIRNAF